MRFTVFGIVVALLGGLGAGCKSDVKYYCDEDTPCLPRYPDRPYCDLTGEYEPDGVRNTCVASPFDAGAPDASVSIDAGVDGGGTDAMTPPDGPEPPEIVVSASSQDFGSVVEGQTSAGVSFTFSNIGGSPSGTLSVATSGTNAADFTTSGDCQGTALQPSADCTVTVTFAPQTPGNKTAKLDVSATPGGDLMVALSGDGLTLGSLSMAPPSHTFASTNVSATSSSQTFTVTNTGGSTTGSLAVSLSNTTDFAITADTCDSTTLGGSGTCQVSVQFGPAVAGSRLGSLIIQANPGGQVSASLGGMGTASITVSKSGPNASGGTVTSSPSGITCGSTCSADFSTSSVTLSASTSVGTVFAGWSGAGCSGTGTCQLSMTANRSVAANFVAACGNHQLDPGEDCDDGNTTAGDGCENNCTFTPGVNYVVTGDYQSCALFWDGRVKCWGYGMYGTLGLGGTDNIGDNEVPKNVPFVDVGGKVIQLSAGAWHTCAVLDTGKLKCWGYGADGQLGYGNLNNIGDDPGEMPPPDVPLPNLVKYVSAGERHTCAILTGGKVRCWGKGGAKLGYAMAGDFPNAGTLPGDVSIGGSATQLATGQAQTCALLDTGDVRCWGDGGLGELGYGNTDSIGDDELPSTVGPVALPAKAVEISAGSACTCARLENGAVYCWGYGSAGRLGYGNTNDIGDNETPTSAGPVSIRRLGVLDLYRERPHLRTASEWCSVLGSGTSRPTWHRIHCSHRRRRAPLDRSPDLGGRHGPQRQRRLQPHMRDDLLECRSLLGTGHLRSPRVREHDHYRRRRGAEYGRGRPSVLGDVPLF